MFCDSFVLLLLKKEMKLKRGKCDLVGTAGCWYQILIEILDISSQTALWA